MNDRAGLAGVYRGDEALAPLLREASSRFDPVGVRALLAGVLAAPAGRDPSAWLDLVAARVTPALATQLAALRAELAQHLPSGERPSGATAARVGALRAELARRGVHGFLIPRADEHQGEYVPARARRLAWLAGFSGSAGVAIVLPEAAAIFVDGRYTLQAEAEVDGALFLRRHLVEQPPSEWVAGTLKPGQILAYDPWLHTLGEVERFRAAAEKAGGSLKPLDGNPVDAVWTDQPAPPLTPATPSRANASMPP
jgi:Xaa-Pro aminopeptidase